MKKLGKRALSMLLALGLTASMLVSDLSVMPVNAMGSVDYVTEDGQAVIEVVSEEASETSTSVEETATEANSVEEVSTDETVTSEEASAMETTELTDEEISEELITEEVTEETTESASEEQEEVQAENDVFATASDNVGFTLSADENGVLTATFETGVTEFSGSVVIPKEVKIIPKKEEFFYTNTGITKVTFEEGSQLEKIEDEAFLATSIKEIKIPVTVSYVGERAFYASKLEKVILEAGDQASAVAIGDGAFSNSSSLTTFTSNGRLSTIGESAFADDKALNQTVDLTGATAIGSKAFYNCEALDYIKIPDTVTVIEESTFENCKSFGQYNIAVYTGTNAVTIGTGVKEIKDNAFAGCTGLEAMILPKNVAKLGNNVFKNCTAMENIKIYNVDGEDKTSACAISLTYTSFPSLKDLVLEAYDGTVEDWVGNHAKYGVIFKTLYKSFNVKIGKLSNGIMTPDVKTAKMGATVTLTVQPEEGYVLQYGSLYYTYTDDAGVPQMGPIDSWDYTFIMPGSDVTVYGTFVKASELEYGEELVLSEEGLFNSTHKDISYDKDKKVLSIPKPWQNVRIQVTGSNNEIPVYSELKFESTDEKIVTIDERGNIRAIAQGTATVKVSFTDETRSTKPLEVEVVVGEKTYVETLGLTYTAPKATIAYAASGGNEAAELGYDIITYSASLLNTYSRDIVLIPNGTDEAGDTLHVTYKISSNDTSVAKPKVAEISGEGTITVPKGASGETVITVKAQDGAKEPVVKQFIVRVIDDTPRLVNSTVTVDPQSVTGTCLDLVSAYGSLENVTNLTIEKKEVKNGNTTYVEADDTFELNRVGDKIYLKALDPDGKKYVEGTKYTFKKTYYIHGTLKDSSMDFYIEIPTVVIYKKTIKPTVKLSGKINLFYNGLATVDKLGKVTVTQNQKDLTVTACELIGTEKTNGVNTADDDAFAENFTVDFNASKQTITIVRTPGDEALSCYTDGKSEGKPVLSGMLTIWYEGYEKPFNVKITVPTYTTAPSYTLDTTKISLNSNASGQEYQVSFIDKKTKKKEDLTDDSTILLEAGTTDGLIWEDEENFAFDTEDDTIQLRIREATKGKIILILRQPDWEDQSAWNKKSIAKGTISVSVSSKFPTAKLGKSTLTLNAACPDAADYTTMKLNQTDSVLVENQEFTPSGKKQDEDLNVYYDAETGRVVAEIAEGGTVAKGTYSFVCYPAFMFMGSDNEDTAKKITVKVKVNDITPSIKLKSGSFTLNANCSKTEDAEKYDYITRDFTWVNLPVEYSDYTLSADDMIIKKKGSGTDKIGASNICLEIDGENKEATVYLESESKRIGSGTYTVSGLKLVNGDKEIPVKNFNITIKSIDKTPTVTVKAKGTINPLDSASKVEYTPKLSNINGTVVEVAIREVDEDNAYLPVGTEHFVATHSVLSGKTTVRVKPGVNLEKRTYTIQLYYELSNGMGTSVRVPGTYQVTKNLSITPKQTMPKVSIDKKSVNFYAGDKSLTQTITVTKKKTTPADISNIKFSSKTSQTLQNAFEIASYDPSSGEMVLRLKNSAFIKQNVEHTLTFEIVCEGQLQGTTGTTFSVKVKVIK